MGRSAEAEMGGLWGLGMKHSWGSFQADGSVVFTCCCAPAALASDGASTCEHAFHAVAGAESAGAALPTGVH